MNKVIFGNLGLLNIYLSDQILISEGNELILMGKDEYETVNKLSSLEYPIYYTYHELLNKISYNKDLSYSTKKYYLDKLYESLDVLIQYIDDYEEENSRLCFIIDNIYERYEIVKSQTIYTWGEKAVILFDDVVDGFRTASKYLYFTPISYYPLMYLKQENLLEDEGECDSDSEESEAGTDVELEESNEEESNEEESNKEESNEEESNEEESNKEESNEESESEEDKYNRLHWRRVQ